MNAPLASLRQLSRRLSRSPMFTVVTLLTLAIGIGANTAIFSIISGVLLKPLPHPEADRLVGVWQTAPGLNLKDVNASPATYFTYREESRTFEDIALWRTGGMTVTGLAEPENVDALFVTDGLLPLLRVLPARGRVFSRKDDSPGSPETVILSHGYWQRRFGGADNAIGRRILIDGTAREVIGVLPRDFRFMYSRPDVVLPFRFNRAEVFIGNFSYQAVARLKPGAGIAQANADVARMLAIMPSKFQPIKGLSLKMLEQARIGPSVRPLKDDLIGDVGNVLWVLMATVGIVLLIACANVANLMLVRAEGRQQELAIRSALGASWGRLARELMLESLTLGAIGGTLGLGLAYAGLRLLVKLSPANLPRLDEIGIDGTVLLFTLGISLLSGLLFGLLPVYKYAGARIALALRAGGRNASESRDRHRARNVLVVGQVALALVLLVGAGLMIRTLQALQNVHPGFTSPDTILTLRISIPEAQVPDAEKTARMEQEIVDRIRALPGVQSAGLVSAITMSGSNSNDPIFAEDHQYAENQIPPLRRYKTVGPDAFRTMGMPLLAGRDFTWTDVYEKRPVVMMSENLARELWGNPAAAIGKRVREIPQNRWREVIGVVGNERDNGVDQPAPTVVYWPLMVEGMWNMKLRVDRDPAIAIRSSRAGSAAFLKEVEQAVWSVNRDLPVTEVRTVREIYDRSLARTSFTLVLLAIAASMALLLGIVGIYGVISYSVSQRTREIGIRIALGAPQSGVRAMFLRHGMILAAIGVGCGVAAAFSLTRLMSGLLFQVSPLDPPTYAAVAAVLFAAAVLATYIPARRATVIEPVQALRAE